MLTDKEKLLLGHLRRNSRKPLAEIGRETGIPLSTLFELLRKLELKAILRHTSLIDFSKIGYTLKVNFIIKARKKQELKEFLLNNANVNTFSSLINGHDFYAECIFRDLFELNRFKEALETLQSGTDEVYVVEELKKEEFNL
jgi:DNA-binding Lrp family transcriptional regulator